MPKTPKGNITVGTDKGWLRLRWRHEGKRYTLTMGLPDTETNRRLAEARADIIRADILASQFDRTLARYRTQAQTDSLSVVELFSRYTDWKRRQVTRVSLDKYLGTSGHLTTYFKQRRVENLSEDQALDFRDYLLRHLASSTARERISLVRSCWPWGISKGLATENPWQNVRVKSAPKQSPQPFTREEYRKILAGFDELYPHYSDFVRWLMGIGCRLGEAAGLRWGHLSSDFSKVWIGESWGRGQRKTTKTNTHRAFELSPDLQIMLKQRHQRLDRSLTGADDLVFTASSGRPIDDHNFRRRYWTPVLQAVEVPYRKPYSTRHTFISHALDQGWSVSEISAITGNSEETILRHYTGSVKGQVKLRSVWAEEKEIS